MEKINIPPSDILFIEALRDLIRTGVLAAPNLETSPLINLAIVKRHSGKGASAAKRAYIFIKILQQVIKHRLEGKEAQTANILFGFEGYAGVPIQDRYRAVAKLYNPYWNWENYRKEPLTRHLLTVYLTLKREAELEHIPSFVTEHPRRARSGLVGQDWVLERFEGLYNLPDREGRPLEAIQTRRLRAVCDKIHTYRHYAYVRERGISGVPQLSLLSPGKITVSDTYVDPLTALRIYVTEITFPKPVQYGESIEFTVVKRVDAHFDQVVQSKGWDWYGLVALASPAESVQIGLRFPPQRRPKEVWRYQDIISGLVRPGSPTKANHLSVDSSGFTSCAWSDLSAGYSYGISLEW